MLLGLPLPVALLPSLLPVPCFLLLPVPLWVQSQGPVQKISTSLPPRMLQLVLMPVLSLLLSPGFSDLRLWVLVKMASATLPSVSLLELLSPVITSALHMHVLQLLLPFLLLALLVPLPPALSPLVLLFLLLAMS